MGEIPAQTRLLRNLKDAGFDEAMIQKYLQLQKEGKRQEQFRASFFAQSISFLDWVFMLSENMIDCLDYLVYSMKNEEK